MKKKKEFADDWFYAKEYDKIEYDNTLDFKGNKHLTNQKIFCIADYNSFTFLLSFFTLQNTVR